MAHLTRIASYGQTNPMPIDPYTLDLTPEQRAEYTFVLTKDDGDEYLVAETNARELHPAIEHLGIGSVFQILP